MLSVCLIFIHSELHVCAQSTVVNNSHTHIRHTCVLVVSASLQIPSIGQQVCNSLASVSDIAYSQLVLGPKRVLFLIYRLGYIRCRDSLSHESIASFKACKHQSCLLCEL